MSLVAATGIPSPSEGVWYLGPLPLRAYGIIIAIGMVVGRVVDRSPLRGTRW